LLTVATLTASRGRRVDCPSRRVWPDRTWTSFSREPSRRRQPTPWTRSHVRPTCDLHFWWTPRPHHGARTGRRRPARCQRWPPWTCLNRRYGTPRSRSFGLRVLRSQCWAAWPHGSRPPARRSTSRATGLASTAISRSLTKRSRSRWAATAAAKPTSPRFQLTSGASTWRRPTRPLPSPRPTSAKRRPQGRL